MTGYKTPLLCLVGLLALCATAAQAADIPFTTAAAPNRLDPALWYTSNGWSNGDHQSCEWRASAVKVTDRVVKLTLSDRGGAVRPIGCGEIHTKKPTGYGRYEARMKTAAGSGLNTAFFTYIGPPLGVPRHDEIDFEFIGKEPNTVDLTVWSNGKNSGPAKRIDLGFDASKDFHDYVIEWRPGSIRWFVDGKQIHMIDSGDMEIPSAPGYTYLSLWSGSKIEDAWMGPFTYTNPVSAEIAWVKYSP